jgi:hypothetical protein
MRIVKLLIDELEEFMGIDAVSLVEDPAIEVDFHAFGKQLEEFESYNDYPKQAIAAAKQGIKRNKELGNKCGTLVGKQRAQQLANGENVSLDTIKRMRSFLLRQKDNYDLAVSRKDYDACGYISYLLWGGPAALPWAEKKLRQAGMLEASNNEIIVEELNEKFNNVTMIDGIPVFNDPNEALQLAEAIGCEGIHEHELEGSIVYMPCKRHSEATDLLLKNTSNQFDKYFDDMDGDVRELLLKALDKCGLSQDTLSADGWVEVEENQFNNYVFANVVDGGEKGSLQDTSQYKVLYKYEGPKDSKNRDFCRELLSKDLLYRIEDINNMSLQGANNEFSSYDIFSYKGSYNCRHRWVQKYFRKAKPIEDQKRATTTNKGPKEVIGGPRVQEASQRNPKSRTLAEILEGIPAGQFDFSKQMEEQKLLAGPLMIADKLIPRIDENGEKYYVFFDQDGIKNLSYKMMQNKLVDSVNIEHDQDRKVDDITLVETWLIEDPEMDKSRLFGYDNLTKGSWFGIYKCNNDKIWNEYVKTGKVKGFSVEGFFTDKIIMNYAVTK